VAARPSAEELLGRQGALLTSSHLAELGLSKKAIAAVFRALPVVILPDFRRPMIRAEDYRDLIERSTYDGDRVWPP
jgi:hypothetical protein